MESKENKKRVVIAYNSLSPELQLELKKAYPLGFTDHMIRIDKPSGDFFYAVVFETPDVSYLVKVDVKIDGGAMEDDDKELFDDDGEIKDEDIDPAGTDIADDE